MVKAEYWHCKPQTVKRHHSHPCHRTVPTSQRWQRRQSPLKLYPVCSHTTKQDWKNLFPPKDHCPWGGGGDIEHQWIALTFKPIVTWLAPWKASQLKLTSFIEECMSSMCTACGLAHLTKMDLSNSFAWVVSIHLFILNRITYSSFGYTLLELTNILQPSNEQLQQELEYTLLKPDYHSWWISKMQSGHEYTLEEWDAIKICFKLGKNATETYEMLQTAFRPSCMNRASVFEWHKRFKKGTESVRDDERCGRRKEVNTPELIGQIKNFMDKDCSVSIETISAQFDVSVGTVHTIIHEELKMWKICAKFVPRVLREDQKERLLSWQLEDIWADQFRSRSSWCSDDLRWKLDLLLRPRDRVLSGSMLALPYPRRPNRANPPTNFWWSLFLKELAWSTCTGFPLDRQSTRNTMLRF